MNAVTCLSSTIGIEPACLALGVARASYYRQRPLLGPDLVTVVGSSRTVSAGDWLTAEGDWVIDNSMADN